MNLFMQLGGYWIWRISRHNPPDQNQLNKSVLLNISLIKLNLINDDLGV